MTRVRMRKPLLIATLLALALWLPASASGSRKAMKAARAKAQKPPELELLSRFAFGAKAPVATGIRWASRDSVYVLTADDGAWEVGLRRGLPRDGMVLPGHREMKGGVGVHPAQEPFAVGGDRIVSAQGAGYYVWAKLSSPADALEARAAHPGLSSVSALDTDGDVLIVLGKMPEALESQYGKTLLWKATFANGLHDFKPFASPGKLSHDEWWRRVMYTDVQAGSLRLLPNGGVFVYPGWGTEALEYSSSGDIKERFDLSKLGLGDPGFDRFISHGPIRFADVMERRNAGLNLIDDVLVIGKTPALVLRSRTRSGLRWFLVTLDTAGMHRYAIPISAGVDSRTRVRADADHDGHIVFLAGGQPLASVDRGGHYQEIVVARLP